MNIRVLATRSFLLTGELGEEHELYPPSINGYPPMLAGHPAIRADLFEPSDGVPEHRTAAVFTHPTVPVSGFYMFEPLLELGLPTLALSTRFLGSDATLFLERCAQDVGTGIRFLKERGYERIILLGFSGGASLSCFYQAQAEHLTATHLPDGRPSGLLPEQLPPADKLVLFGQHLGRAQTLRNVLDAAVVDEQDPTKTDPSLDVFDERNGPPFSDSFIERVRTAQAARMERITTRVENRLRVLEEQLGPGADEAFVVYRTNADPYMFDAKADRKGNVEVLRSHNYAVNGLGRYTSLRSWLSQWATSSSQADGPRDLAKTSIPVLSIVQTADHRAHPRYLKQWEAALGSRFQGHHRFDSAHYMDPLTQHAMITDLARLITDFALSPEDE